MVKLIIVILAFELFLSLFFLFGYFSSYVKLLVVAHLVKTLFFFYLFHYRRSEGKLRASGSDTFDLYQGTAHEIRTPLNSILACTDLVWLEAVRHGKSEDSLCAQYLEVIRGSVEHLRCLVTDILELGKVRSLGFQLRSSPFDLKRELRLLLSQFRMSQEHLEKSVNFFLLDEIDRFRVGDALRFRQVLFNLLNNAVKFTPRDGGCIQLFVELSRDGADLLLFRLVDNGSGVSAEEAENLFQPFFQASAGLDSEYAGTGLGLAISRLICESMGGSISAFPSHGSQGGLTVEFSLKLPVDDSAQPEKMVGELQVMNSSDVASPLPPTSCCLSEIPGTVVASIPSAASMRVERERVLVVDDNALSRKIFSHFLASLEVDFLICKSAADAFAHYPGGIFDFAFIDFNLPDLNGDQLVKELRIQSSQKACHCQFFAFTAAPEVIRDDPQKLEKKRGSEFFPMADKEFAMEELTKHNSVESLWFAVDGVVYDVTDFQEEHPGGGDILLDNSGMDATSAFHRAGHTDGAIASMKEFAVGKVKGYVPPARGQKTGNEMSQGGSLMIIASIAVVIASAALSYYLKNI